MCLLVDVIVVVGVVIRVATVVVVVVCVSALCLRDVVIVVSVRLCAFVIECCYFLLWETEHVHRCEHAHPIIYQQLW